MGNESSSEASSPVTGPPTNSKHHGVELRNNTLSKARQPTELKQMPNREELDKRYTTVLMSMDLPPDKMKLLKNYDDDKKWELIRDQDLVTAKNPPSYYLDKLRVYLDPKGTKHKKKQMLGDETSTQTLRDLEISLRTNQVQWVREFLSEENKGLDVLVKYLFESQAAMREELMSTSTESDVAQNSSASMTRKSSHPNTASLSKAKSHRLKPSSSKLNFGDATDDVHVCIMCLRAIMNHQYGFNLVFAHKEAINCIALSLNHNSMRTKTLVLELLAAVCLVRGGHQITLTAFDNFKEVCSERRRFETLMHYFRSPEEFHIDFMVACMQFINIVVHSVENVNFRVHLQHEFSLLGLDDYLEELRQTESDVLSIQVRAYIDNLIDVASLLEDSDTKTDALERVAELEENLSWEKERAQAAEREASAQIAAIRNELEETRSELENYKALCGQQEEQLRFLEKNLKEKETETLKRQSMLEDKLKELEDLRKNLQNTTVLSPRSPKTPQSAEVSVAPPMPPPPPPPPPPPAPPAPSMPPPGPPPLPGSVTPALHIKKALQPKHRLPVLNWVAMKPQEVKGTVFAELDDEKLYEVIDFDQFETLFKLGDALLNTDESTPKSLRKAAKQETISLLETNRLRNVAITRRKMECSEEEMVRAINSLDLKSLSLERVEILMRIVPNEQEIKAFKEYEKEKKPLSALSEEDRFMMTLWKIERLTQKLNIMSFIGNFFDIRNTLVPQLQAVIAASRSIRNSEKVRKMLEIILAFGNYMNSSKRGAVYGFKLQSLDMLLDTKTADKKLTLLHYIVQTVQQKFPEIQNFENELNFLEKASTVSLENILSYIQELDKGMEATRREYNLRKENERPPILQEFLSKAEDMTKDLKADIKSAQEAYKSAVEYFGENPKTLAPNTFFSLFVRFVRSYRQAIIDLDNMRKAEINQIATRASIREKKASNRQTQQDLLIELKKMQRAVRDKKVMNPDDLYHGALDDILLDMKSAPYRRADAVRKSQRRRIERQISEVESEHL